MKKIIICLIILAALPSMAFGDSAAPYTEDALEKVIKAISETPKLENTAELPKEESLRQFIEYYSTVFSKAGYSFSDTISQIVDDMKNDPDAIPKDRKSVYNNLYILLNLLTYECNSNKVDCLKFFPPDTRESVQWFAENNKFNKNAQDKHHMGQK